MTDGRGKVMVRRGLMLLGVLLAAGCMSSRVEEFAPASYTRGDLFGHRTDNASESIVLPPPVAEQVTQLVNESFAHPTAWTAEAKKEADKRRLHAGHKLYQQHCLTCHGKGGAGDGGIALTVSPRPRDFRRGIFKWKSTERTSKPMVDDLVRTIQRGIPGTAMQGFSRLDKNDVVLLAEFVVYLSQRGEYERRLLTSYASEGPLQSELDQRKETPSADDIAEWKELLQETATDAKESIIHSWKSAGEHVVAPSIEYPDWADDSAEGKESIARGQQLFVGTETGCSKCHGTDGKGEKNLSPDQTVDDWGFSNPPRDLTTGAFRGGNDPIDLYRRIHQGIAGSTMPSITGSTKLTEGDIWDLVRFIKSLTVPAPTGTASQGPAPTGTASTR
jgi:mono/diheme cytochrome c family protein